MKKLYQKCNIIVLLYPEDVISTSAGSNPYDVVLDEKMDWTEVDFS